LDAQENGLETVAKRTTVRFTYSGSAVAAVILALHSDCLQVGTVMSAVEPIAIVRIGCRLPGDVRRPDDLWNLLLLELAYHAVEDAGLTLAALANKLASVYIGICNRDYSWEVLLFSPRHTELTGFRIGSPDQKRTPNVAATARHLGLSSYFFDSRHE
jgi:acyl transferase domain-containing protein